MLTLPPKSPADPPDVVEPELHPLEEVVQAAGGADHDLRSRELAELAELGAGGAGRPSRGALQGSFSAVSKRNFARKYAFDSIFQALQDLHPFAPLQSQNFRKKSV